MEEAPTKGGLNIACSTLPGWPTAATGLSHMRSRKVQGKFFNKTTATRCRKLECAYSTGHWARSSASYRAHGRWSCQIYFDIATLSESRLPEKGSLVEIGTGYTFFWSGLPKDASLIHGVGFAIRTVLLQSIQESPIAIDDRLMTLRLQLTKNRFASFVIVYDNNNNNGYF